MSPLRFALPLSVVVLLAAPTPARAEVGDWNLHFEPAAAMFVSAPQSERFGWGGGAALKLEYAISERLGVFAAGEALVFQDGAPPPASSHLRDPGTGGLLLLGGGVRFRPFNDQSGYAIHAGDGHGHHGNLFGNVWIDVIGGLVRTSNLHRPGVGAGIGLELSLVDGVQVGPFVKYLQVIETQSQLAPEDARIVMAGLSATIGAPGVHLEDRDGDGIADDDDRCPDQAEDPDGFEDADGCPELDNDDDGIPDARDRCPIVPEDADGFEDHDGCPEDGPPPAVVPPVADTAPVNEVRDEEADILLEERVLFDTSVARVRTRYRPLVQAVQTLLKDHDEYLRIRVEGHADERGTDAFNEWLSTERARRASRVLEHFGVDPSRIEIVGYGRGRPAVPGRTLNALRLNRRVNFRIILVRREIQIVPGVDSGSDEPPTPPLDGVEDGATEDDAAPAHGTEDAAPEGGETHTETHTETDTDTATDPDTQNGDTAPAPTPDHGGEGEHETAVHQEAS